MFVDFNCHIADDFVYSYCWLLDLVYHLTFLQQQFSLELEICLFYVLICYHWCFLLLLCLCDSIVLEMMVVYFTSFHVFLAGLVFMLPAHGPGSERPECYYLVLVDKFFEDDFVSVDLFVGIVFELFYFVFGLWISELFLHLIEKFL